MKDITGQTINNRYRVDAFLGKGGMSEVYKVWDAQRATDLAMKVLSENLSEDRVFIRRFKREAQTLSLLDHPNIVRFYGFEQTEEMVYILMEYVEGTTLRKVLARTSSPFEAEQVLSIMRPACSALYYAHQKGRIHCDVKPANLMIDHSGKVHLADFGITQITDATTATMVGAGTPAYMAPEQIMGQELTTQTDLYALGIILYEMLSGGERPFTGEYARTTGSNTQKVYWEHINLEVPPLHTHNPEILPKVEQVVLKCLEKDPKKRHANALELLKALEDAYGDELMTEIDSSRFKIEQSMLTSADLTPLPRTPDAPATRGRDGRASKGAGNGLLPWIMKYKIPLSIMGVIILLYILIAGGSLGSTQLSSATATQANREISAKVPAQVSFSTMVPADAQIIADTSTPLPAISSTPASTVKTSPIDGMEMVYVPAGEFLMGNSFAGAPNKDKPQKRIVLDAFWIDQTEVSNGMYQKCTSDGSCKQPKDRRSNASEPYYDEPMYRDYPVIFVDWNQAEAYCRWAGRRLPSEAEWEKAARGTDGRPYPWGTDLQINPNLLNSGTNPVLKLDAIDSHKAGRSPYGAYNMAGNVAEWVADWFDPKLYTYIESDNPQGPTGGQTRVVRGGSYESDYNSPLHDISTRYNEYPVFVGPQTGFRCAMDADE